MTVNNGTNGNKSMFLTNEVQKVNMSSLPSLDDYNTWIKILFTAVNIPLIAFSLLAVVSLNRTRRTPETARFLSSGLITMDILSVIGFTVRKFIDDHTANTMVQVIAVNFTWLAYLTVGIMSLERLIVFNWPNYYLRIFNPSRVRKTVFCAWILLSVLYFYVRIGACYFATPNFIWLDVIGSCNTVSFAMYFIGIVGVIVASSVCYIRIFRIVKSEHIPSKSSRFKSTARSLQNYKATSIVFVYLVVIITTSLGYILILSLRLNTTALRLSTDVVNTISCMLDSCFYVLWFRECRMEMLKMASHFCPGVEDKIELMRLKIFHVVTVENGTFRRTNKVSPLSNNSPTMPPTTVTNLDISLMTI